MMSWIKKIIRMVTQQGQPLHLHTQTNHTQINHPEDTSKQTSTATQQDSPAPTKDNTPVPSTPPSSTTPYPASSRYLPEPNPAKPLALVAGAGQLPINVAKQAKAMGYNVVAFTLFGDNKSALKPYCTHIEPIAFGQIEANLALSRKHNIEHVIFAGKVNKWLLFKNPKLDKRAFEALNTLRQRNDDRLMLGIIELLAEENLNVLNQSDFLIDHYKAAGTLTHTQPTDTQKIDIQYGLRLAKESGRLDIGQTVVVSNGMILAIEAIEGTDECLKRAGKWSKGKGGVVVKVSKPNQDQRFDIPTVGLNTLKQMRKSGLNILATEAHQTFFIDPEAMIAFADKHGMMITSVEIESPYYG